MATVVSMFEVDDFDQYWVFHNQQLELRRDHGCTGSRVLRGAHSSGELAIVMEFPSVSDAERYVGAALAEGGARRAGALDAPRIQIYVEAGTTA
jgi:hypothetical protein